MSAADAPPPPEADFYAPSGWDAQEGLLFRLRRAQVALNHLVNDELALEPSTLPQWVPLHQIHTGRAHTVAELARRCMVDAGSMTRLLDRLEAKGLCRRVRSQTDRRVVQIELTPAGQAAATSVPAALARIYNASLAGFSAPEWAQFQMLLERLSANAEACVAARDEARASGPPAARGGDASAARAAPRRTRPGV